MTIEELNALPEGTKVRDHTVDGALWVKHPDDRWHLIEQANGFTREGRDWSGPLGDSAESVWGFGRVELTVVS